MIRYQRKGEVGWTRGSTDVLQICWLWLCRKLLLLNVQNWNTWSFLISFSLPTVLLRSPESGATEPHWGSQAPRNL